MSVLVDVTSSAMTYSSPFWKERKSIQRDSGFCSFEDLNWGKPWYEPERLTARCMHIIHLGNTFESQSLWNVQPGVSVAPIDIPFVILVDLWQLKHVLSIQDVSLNDQLQNPCTVLGSGNLWRIAVTQQLGITCRSPCPSHPYWYKMYCLYAACL